MRRITVVLCVVSLASCTHAFSAMPAGAPDAAVSERGPALGGSGYQLVYSFKNGDDGGFPYDTLANISSTLYGTTYGGSGGGQWGTVFALESGRERVLYRFKAGNDGAHPIAGLIALGGTLYGTTYQGGTSGAGTVFRITPSGRESVLYSFKAGSDGEYPYSQLTVLGGTLYGTTYQGGVSTGWGTVFSVSKSGTEKILYRFRAGSDGAHPYAGLTPLDGVLYGTTYQGGTHGAGTVFKVTTSGQEHVIYSFKAGTDGEYPLADLLAVSGTFYSTTYQGGASTGWGTVFQVSPAGKERVLYRFQANDNGTHDGAHPYFSGLVLRDGIFYGTTYQGGTYGAGTVFSVSDTGKETVLYSFKGQPDGQYPYAGLNDLGGSLYGTTLQGGPSDAGTVFKFAP